MPSRSPPALEMSWSPGSRRGPAVFALLAAAGLLRPDAWFVAGAYWLWCVVPSRSSRVSRRTLISYTALAAIGPLVDARVLNAHF